ncbi:transglycosylase [Rugosimonospora acidiphila]|uniref:Transglycosylase n=1 Tax=Rugosimonospora acidiphila TaxID=556531 RepID=A0ABP9RSU9_9ACTN
MTVAGIISAILVGLVIGALGRLVIPGRQNIPIWLTIIVGIVAAFIGTAVAKAVGVADTSGFDWIEFFIQIGVAALGVALVSGIGGGRRTLSHR